MAISVIDGPLVQAEGPHDHEGLGRERFWDMTPKQRRDNLSRITEQANAGALQAPDKEFARGWLSELERYRRHHGDPLGDPQ